MRQTRNLQWIKAVSCVALSVVATLSCADTIDELIDNAYHTYPSIQSKQMTQKSAEKEILAAKLGFLPAVSVSSQALHRNYGAYTDVKGSQTTVAVKQPLLGGGVYSNFKLAKAKKNQADWLLEETRLDVAIRVINAYATWYGAHKKLAAANESVIAHRKLTELISRRMTSGVSTQSDVDQSNSRLAQARAEEASYRSAEFSALVTLNQLVGRQLDRTTLLNGVDKQVVLPNDIIAKALSVSPTIHRLQSAAQVAEQQANVVKSQAYPQVSLQAQRNYGSTTANNVEPYTSVGLVVEYSSGHGFASLARGSASEDLYRSALLDVETARRDLVVTINQNVSEYEFAKIRKPVMEKTVTLTQNVSESYDRLFRVGKKSWLDLLNSVRERTQALTALADVEATLLSTGRRLKVYTTPQNTNQDTPTQDVGKDTTQ
ncbi:MAG: outer rane efflux protein [Burkholderiaceae bacterium]|nr:outer rane efflux protein [Burkholderiaceae bacterium]